MRTEHNKQNNYVAKYCDVFNKPKTHLDKKKHLRDSVTKKELKDFYRGVVYD